MRQAIHIFKKDARHLRFEIAGMLAMLALFIVTDVRPIEMLRRGASGVFEIVPILLLAAWCFLIARVVHAETIPGDRQFWVTRPYNRASLLLAKAMFIVAFVNLPFLIAQGAILKLNAFPILANAGALLWEQVLVTAVVTLPALALAAMTANMIQFIVGAVLMGALAYGPLTGLHDLGAVGWLARSALAILTLAAGLVILWLQYRLRKTFVSLGVTASGILLGLALIMFVPWASAFPSQSHLAEPLRSSLRVELRPDLDAGVQGKLMPRGSSVLSIPLRLTGAPGNTLLRCEGAELTITAPSGSVWRGRATFNSPFRKIADGCVDVRFVDRSFLETHREERVRIHGTLSLTIFGNPRSTDLSMEASTEVPGVGQCLVLPREAAPARQTDVRYFLCLAALRWPRLLVTGHATDRVTGDSFGTDVSYSPFPADFRISPVESNLGLVAGEAITITTQEPLAHVRSEFDATNIRLGDVETPTANY